MNQSLSTWKQLGWKRKGFGRGVMNLQFLSAGSCSIWANGPEYFNEVQPMARNCDGDLWACNQNTLTLRSSGHQREAEESGVSNFHDILHAGFWDIFPLNCLSCAKSSSSKPRSRICCAISFLIACFDLLCLCYSWSFPGEMEQEECQLFSNKPWWGCSNMGQKGELRVPWAACAYSHLPDTDIPLSTDKYWEKRTTLSQISLAGWFN